MSLGLLRVLGLGSPRQSVPNGKQVEAAADPAGRTRTPSDPFEGGKQVTPSDTVDLADEHRALWIGTAGTLKVDVLDADGTTRNTITTSVPCGIFPFHVLRVYSTGTTATGIATGF